jgi:hypothetical protein
MLCEHHKGWSLHHADAAVCPPKFVHSGMSGLCFRRLTPAIDILPEPTDESKTYATKLAALAAMQPTDVGVAFVMAAPGVSPTDWTTKQQAILGQWMTIKGLFHDSRPHPRFQIDTYVRPGTLIRNL